MKYLMLKLAFEDLGLRRVEFCVHPSNEKSNQAMLRIGAKLEGTLRQWRFLAATDSGDRNIYSVLSSEWSDRKKWFQDRLARE
jgi:N-acetyltransferase